MAFSLSNGGKVETCPWDEWPKCSSSPQWNFSALSCLFVARCTLHACQIFNAYNGAGTKLKVSTLSGQSRWDINGYWGLYFKKFDSLEYLKTLVCHVSHWNMLLWWTRLHDNLHHHRILMEYICRCTVVIFQIKFLAQILLVCWCWQWSWTLLLSNSIWLTLHWKCKSGWHPHSLSSHERWILYYE